jgi:hypothetical protein
MSVTGANLAGARGRQPEALSRTPHEARLVQDRFELLELLPRLRKPWEGIRGIAWELFMLVWRSLLEPRGTIWA